MRSDEEAIQMTRNDDGIYKAHLRPPHIPRRMPTIYHVLEGIEGKPVVIKKLTHIFRRSNKGQGRITMGINL